MSAPGSAAAEPLLDPAAVARARAARPPSAEVTALANLFGALADPTRLRLIAALAEGELCVGDLAATLDLSQSAISHQLRLLRHLGLVRPRRAGRVVFYTLDDEHVLTLYSQSLAHVSHASPEADPLEEAPAP